MLGRAPSFSPTSLLPRPSFNGGEVVALATSGYEGNMQGRGLNDNTGDSGTIRNGDIGH